MNEAYSSGKRSGQRRITNSITPHPSTPSMNENLSRVRTAGGSSSRSRRCSRTRLSWSPVSRFRIRRRTVAGSERMRATRSLAAVHRGGRSARRSHALRRRARSSRRSPRRMPRSSPRSSRIRRRTSASSGAAVPGARAAARSSSRDAASPRGPKRCSDSWTIRSTASSYRRVPPGVPPGGSDSAPSVCSLWECSFCNSFCRASGESADPLGASAPPLGASFSEAVESSADVATVSSFIEYLRPARCQPARRRGR